MQVRRLKLELMTLDPVRLLIGICFLDASRFRENCFCVEFIRATLRFLSRESIAIPIPAGKAYPLNLRNILPQRLQVAVFQGHEANVPFARQINRLAQQL